MYQDLTLEEIKKFDELKEDVKKNPDRHTVLETKLMQYITKERFTIDFLDRNVGRPQQDIDVTSDGKGIQKHNSNKKMFRSKGQG